MRSSNSTFFRKLGEIKPFIHEKKILIGLDSRWLDYFETKNPSFQVNINSENKIILLGPKVTNPADNATVNGVDISE